MNAALRFGLWFGLLATRVGRFAGNLLVPLASNCAGLCLFGGVVYPSPTGSRLAHRHQAAEVQAVPGQHARGATWAAAIEAGDHSKLSGAMPAISDHCGELRSVVGSGPSAPRRVAMGSGSPSGVRGPLPGEIRALASQSGGAKVVGRGEAGIPDRVGSFRTSGECVAAASSRGYAYVVEARPPRLDVVDLSQPASPTLVGQWRGPWGEDTYLRSAVVVSEALVYAAVEGYDQGNEHPVDGLLVFRVSDPAKPELASLWKPDWVVHDVEAAANHAYVLGTGPTEGAGPGRSLHIPPPGWQGYQAKVHLEILEMSVPESPRSVGHWSGGTGNGPVSLVVLDQRAYVASSNLYVLDVSNPADPRELGRHALGSTWLFPDLAVSGFYAYVVWMGDATGGALQVFDLHDPTHPRMVCELTDVYADSVAVWGRYLYANSWEAGTTSIEVFDLLDPAHPRRAGLLRGPASVYRLRAIDKLLTACGGEAGLLLYDLPELPAFVGIRTLFDGRVRLSWNAPAVGLELVRSSVVDETVWEDVPDSTGTNTVVLPGAGAAGFFRLVAP